MLRVLRGGAGAAAAGRRRAAVRGRRARFGCGVGGGEILLVSPAQGQNQGLRRTVARLRAALLSQQEVLAAGLAAPAATLGWLKV